MWQLWCLRLLLSRLGGASLKIRARAHDKKNIFNLLPCFAFARLVEDVTKTGTRQLQLQYCIDGVVPTITILHWWCDIRLYCIDGVVPTSNSKLKTAAARRESAGAQASALVIAMIKIQLERARHKSKPYRRKLNHHARETRYFKEIYCFCSRSWSTSSGLNDLRVKI